MRYIIHQLPSNPRHKLKPLWQSIFATKSEALEWFNAKSADYPKVDLFLAEDKDESP